MLLKKRQKEILKALEELGGEATTRQIAAKTNLNVNGVSQSLGAMKEHVSCLGGKAGETRWMKKLQNHAAMCHECENKYYPAVIRHFTCGECGNTVTARHGGQWSYCDKCARKLSKCAMCGKQM
jgi:hypothetical protein